MNDERITQIKQKINAETGNLLIITLFISMIIKILVFRTDILQCIPELACIVLSGFYSIIRHFVEGINYLETMSNKRSKYFYYLAGLTIAALLYGIITYLQEKDKYIGIFDLKFIVNTAFSLFVFTFMFITLEKTIKSIMNKRIEKIEAELDRDEFDKVKEKF